MAKLCLHISGDKKTVSVYINNEIVDMETSVFSGKYICDLPVGTYNVKIVKTSELSNNNWKKTIAYNWLSCLSGSPDYTIEELIISANESSVCFDVDLLNDVMIKIKLLSTGFEIVKGIENCNCIDSQNYVNKQLLSKIKFFLVMPLIFLISIIVFLLICCCIFLIIKNQIMRSAIVFILTACLSTLFIWLISKTLSKFPK